MDLIKIEVGHWKYRIGLPVDLHTNSDSSPQREKPQVILITKAIVE